LKNDDHCLAICATLILCNRDVAPSAAVDLAASILGLVRNKQIEYAETARLRQEFAAQFENPARQK
jgi:hypothetical protein